MRFRHGRNALDDGAVLRPPDHDAGMNLGRESVVRHVGAGDEIEFGERCVGIDLPRECALQRDGFFGSEVPIVEFAYLHNFFWFATLRRSVRRFTLLRSVANRSESSRRDRLP